MKLLIDIGNSRLKFSLADGSGLGEVVALPHHGDPVAALAHLPDAPVASIHVASVTGVGLEAPLASALQSRYRVVSRFARSCASRHGLQLSYAQPERFGVDRWLMLLALWHEYRGAFSVAGAGTALTFDAVDAQGLHLGGFIAAGLGTHLNATLASTRFRTGDVDIPFGKGLAQDTEGCVRQGALLACVGAIDRGAALAGPGRRVLSGGDSAILHPHMGDGWVLRPHLVLEGLLANALDGG